MANADLKLVKDLHCLNKRTEDMKIRLQESAHKSKSLESSLQAVVQNRENIKRHPKKGA